VSDVDFGGGTGSFATWDGKPLSRDAPHGAAVVVASRSPDGWKLLLLHRAHHGPDYAGDWAWTPPSGGRVPGETPQACASRELLEETGISGTPASIGLAGDDWALFLLEVPWGTSVRLDGEEHDRFEWVSVREALSRCRPIAVAEGVATAVALLSDLI
jgi:8-oxo-dGTP pyrophosphatase MutT (NUDIX family)